VVLVLLAGEKTRALELRQTYPHRFHFLAAWNSDLEMVQAWSSPILLYCMHCIVQ